MITINEHDIAKYEVYENISSNLAADSIEALLMFNVKHLNLNKEAWTIHKGKRQQRVYKTLEGNVAIIDDYQYVTNGSNIVSYTRSLNFILKNGDVGATKVINNDQTSGSISRLNQEVRKNIIADLSERAAGLVVLSETVDDPYKTFYLRIGNSTNYLLDYYFESIQRGYELGFEEFIGKLQNETNEDVLDYLNTPASTDGTTVKLFILSELL